MNKFFARSMGGCLLGAFFALSVSCSSEQKAAKRIDYTSDIVRQSTALIAADPELKRYHIEVDGFKGAMRLKGEVATPAQKQRAERLVWTSKGVRSVENDLEVTSTSPSK